MAGRGATSAVMRAWVQAGRRARGQAPVVVLAAALLFNLGQGALRPTLPLYLQQVFAANYQMVTLIPLVFGIGKWVASLPTGYLLHRLERRRLMAGGLLVIAVCDVGSVMTSAYGVFLGFRALAGVGWAMFGTVATTTMVAPRGPPFLLAGMLVSVIAWRCHRQSVAMTPTSVAGESST
jgi:MFS family permease